MKMNHAYHTNLGFDEVRMLRDSLAADDPRQRPLALVDRRSFAREFTRDTYGLGALSMLPAVPLEALYKAMSGYGRSGRTPILPTIGAGYRGTLQGLGDLLGY
jgi:hypothetical protein